MELKLWDFIKVIHRSLYIQATWNRERMLSMGYCFCLLPLIKKIFPKAADKAKFLKRNLEFFNTHPYMATFVVGSVLKLEQQHIETQKPDPKEIARVKKRLGESLAAIGDQLFWGKIKPVAAMIGVGIALFEKAPALWAFLIFFNLPHLYMRITGMFRGYKHGFGLIKEVSLGKYNKILDNLDSFAAFCGGVLLILIGFSDMIADGHGIAAFSVGLLSMMIMLKLKISIPFALIILISATTVLGTLIY